MTNETLVASLKASGAIRAATIEDAFRAVDRARFVPEESRAFSYQDTALPIGAEQTISQPTVVALCLTWLSVEPGDRVLDVGSGSGWTTALLAHLVGPTGSVIGIERIPELVALGSKNLELYSFTHARIEQAGSELGKPGEAPYDRILVSASADEVPDALVRQLKDGGRMVIPVRNSVCVVDCAGGRFTTVCHDGFVFVPLIS